MEPHSGAATHAGMGQSGETHPPRPSRVGQSLSLKACDWCRARKKKCRFLEDPSCCVECRTVKVTCSFNESRKKRGPRSWHLKRFKEGDTADASSSQEELPKVEIPPHLLPIGEAAKGITIEHLVPLSIFEMIIKDYLTYVYPVIPAIHIPTFQRLLTTESHHTSPQFLRLCLSICAITISSIPRKISTFGFTHYPDASTFVTRAYLLVMTSRYSQTPEWADKPSVDTLICSYLLSCASHYTEKSERAWLLMNESLQVCRELKIWCKEGYEELGGIDAEICKRVFWLLYIVQVHDRLSHISLYAQLGQDPVLRDWEFLMPLEISDEELEQESWTSETQPQLQTGTPLISGFTALIKVFLCVGQLISTRKPLSNDPNPSWTTKLRLNPPYIPHGPAQEILDIDSLRQMLRNLTNVLSDLPPELQIPSSIPSSASSPQGDSQKQREIQFGIMQANIHITRIFFQSHILERCSTVFYDSSDRDRFIDGIDGIGEGDMVLGPEQRTNIELWKAREGIATELLGVLGFCTRESLEGNGASVIIKIREIAATLLGRDDERIIGSDVARRAEGYIKNFIEVLSVLDYSGRSLNGGVVGA